MKLVNENIDNVLAPKDNDDIKTALEKLSFDETFDLVEEMWGGDPYEKSWEQTGSLYNFVMDISRYMGKFKFRDMMKKLIILKYKEQI